MPHGKLGPHDYCCDRDADYKSCDCDHVAKAIEVADAFIAKGQRDIGLSRSEVLSLQSAFQVLNESAKCESANIVGKLFMKREHRDAGLSHAEVFMLQEAFLLLIDKVRLPTGAA